MHRFQQLRKNLLNLSGRFAELQVYSSASVESYCAHTGKMHWVGTTAALVTCVILEVPFSSAASVIQYKNRDLLSSLTEAV